MRWLGRLLPWPPHSRRPFPRMSGPTLRPDNLRLSSGNCLVRIWPHDKPCAPSGGAQCHRACFRRSAHDRKGRAGAIPNLSKGDSAPPNDRQGVRSPAPRGETLPRQKKAQHTHATVAEPRHYRDSPRPRCRRNEGERPTPHLAPAYLCFPPASPRFSVVPHMPRMNSCLADEFGEFQANCDVVFGLCFRSIILARPHIYVGSPSRQR